MKPHEFWNCTYRELVEYVNSNTLQSEEEYKKQIYLFEEFGNKIISAVASKRAKKVDLISDVFRELFKEELENKDKPQTIEEQIRNLRSRK